MLLGSLARFDEGEVRRQDEVLVAVHGVQYLFGHDVAAAVAGDDQGVDFLIGKGRFFLAEQAVSLLKKAVMLALTASL